MTADRYSRAVKVDGVKVTWIAPDEAFDQRDRDGFVDVCCYGVDLEVHRNEVGCIAATNGDWRATHVPGIYTIPVRVSERIFIVEPEMP